MSTASPEILYLARRLLGFEAPNDNASDPRADVTVQVIEELRSHLITLVGVDGFRALLSRALSLAKADVPSLNIVHVRADGSLEGLDVIGESQEATAQQAGIVLVTHVLKLLVTFIGESLTLRLVRDKWPDAFTGEADMKPEEKQ